MVQASAQYALAAAAELEARILHPCVAVAAAVTRRFRSAAFGASPPRSDPCGWPEACSVLLGRVSPLWSRGDGH